MNEDEQQSRIYAIRFTPRARADIELAHSYLMEKADAEIADQWQAGLFDAISTLATSPHRFATALENARFHQELRQLIYRRHTGSVAYRILFTIIETSQDTPMVRVLHVRHSAARPITRAEAREIETDR